MGPCIERSGFSHCRYDEAEVLNNGFIVRENYTFTSYIVVTPVVRSLAERCSSELRATFPNKG